MIEKILRRFAYVRAIEASLAAVAKENGELKTKPGMEVLFKAAALDLLVKRLAQDGKTDLLEAVDSCLLVGGGMMLMAQFYPKAKALMEKCESLESERAKKKRRAA